MDISTLAAAKPLSTGLIIVLFLAAFFATLVTIVLVQVIRLLSAARKKQKLMDAETVKPAEKIQQESDGGKETDFSPSTSLRAKGSLHSE